MTRIQTFGPLIVAGLLCHFAPGIFTAMFLFAALIPLTLNDSPLGSPHLNIPEYPPLPPR